MSGSRSPIDEMFLEGLEMKRAQIRRAHPGLDDETVEKLLREWIMSRPMDAPGRVRFV